MARPRIPLSDKIERNIVRIPESGCWIWMSSLNPGGYGKTGLGRGSCLSAHRVSYENKYGAIPKNKLALHTCDITCCVNPDHIFIGTQKDNMIDKVKKNRQAKGEKHGQHKLTEMQAIEIKFSAKSSIELSKEFDCSITAIRQIKSGLNWKHLEKE
ncbi:HNH nuclease [uncultured Caudovirales phage]|uniref:HNH nuclease n=1 Tax=uncultured Caudovirales phage TaxID=2100421 RepID=A0A6J5Q9A9_9CAUD|nr:HNH nuclease [uncultured Caudovirales phage]